MSLFTCFGYGSLVNLATLAPDVLAVPVRLTGWRRAWRLSGPSSYGRRCTLTVVPDPGCAIDGVLIAQPGDRLRALDKREAEYNRTAVQSEDVEWLAEPPVGWPAPFLYVGRPEHTRPGDADHPVLLTYLDAVIAGFLRLFGPAGAERFVATTLDWHVPIRDDRADPVYPRAVSLSGRERAYIDGLLAELGTIRLPNGRAG
jgi:glutathione-specific gamma-glutamylcyclotransferase